MTTAEAKMLAEVRRVLAAFEQADTEMRCPLYLCWRGAWRYRADYLRYERLWAAEGQRDWKRAA